MTLKHLLVNILGVGENNPKKNRNKKKKKEKIKKRNVLGNNIFLYVYTHPETSTNTRAGAWVCAQFCFDKLDSFQVHFHGSKKTFKETKSKLRKQIKKSLLEEQKSLVKHRLCAVTIRFPTSYLKTQTTKNPFFPPKRPFQSKGCCARICIQASSVMGRRKHFILPSQRMRCHLQGTKNYT